MPKSLTHLEIASDYRLWMTYADTGANDSEDDFNRWSLSERVAMLDEMFGTDTTTPTEALTNA